NHFVNSSGTAAVGIDIGNCTVGAGDVGGADITVADSVFEGAYTSVVRVGFGSYTGVAPRDIHLLRNEMNGGGSPTVAVYNLKNTTGFQIIAGVWPTLPGGAKNWISDASNSNGEILDILDNSANYTLAGT